MNSHENTTNNNTPHDAGDVAQCRARVLSFVSGALGNTGRAPLGQGAGTIMMALESPIAGIRVQALGALDAALATPAPTPTQVNTTHANTTQAKENSIMHPTAAGEYDVALFREAVMRRLHDDSMDVVLAALQLRHIGMLPSLVLADVLVGVWERCIHVSRWAKAKAMRQTARQAAVQVWW